MKMKSIIIICLTFVIAALAQQPYYIKQCQRDDPEINQCLINSANHLTKELRSGIAELEMEEVEPVLIDEISIALGSGPDGYRAMFRDIEAFGVSNLTVSNIRSDIESLQFQITIEIPKINVKAHYHSSGVLLLVKASGKGDYWGEYRGVKAKVYFRASPKSEENGQTFLSLEEVKMDFSVKHLKMGVENIANSNPIIQSALNLFINNSAQELLKEMKPTIRAKLTVVLENFMHKLFKHIPLEAWIN